MPTDLSIVIAGLLNSGLVQLAKYIQSIPVLSGQTARLRTIAAVLAVITTVVTALATGTLGTDANVLGLLRLLSDMGATWLVSHMTFAAFFRNANTQ